MNLNILGRALRDLLELKLSAVSVTFCPSAPAGVKRVSQAQPAGCAYWKLAGEGEVFYAAGVDHLNCTIGAYTHNVALPPEKSEELQEMVRTMVNLNYISMDEVRELPRRTDPFGVAVYAPLEKAPCFPDVVIVRADAKRIMLVAEAARAAGIGDNGATMGRPACAMIPQAMQSSKGTTSLGCIGNRVYTQLENDELYFTIPGEKLEQVVMKIEKIVDANRKLEAMHLQRFNQSRSVVG